LKRANKIKKIPFALLSILLLTNPYKTFAIEEEWQYIEDDCSKDKLAGIEKDKLFSIEKAVQNAISFLNKDFKESSLDFVKQAFGDMWSNEMESIDKSKIIRGDLIYYNNEVGIYLGDNKVICIENGKVVTKSINENPIKDGFKEAKRVKIPTNNLGTGSGSGWSNRDDAWLTPGTEQYKVAEQVFKHFTEVLGWSGAAAAGVMANIRGESQFVPDAAERGDWKTKYPNAVGGVLRFGMNSKEAPPGAWGWQGPSTRNTSYFGGGLVQFTPFTRFTNSPFWNKNGVSGWDAPNQIDMLWDEEFAGREVEHYMKSTNRRYGAAHYGKAPQFNSIEEWISTNDPVKSAIAFQVGFERPKDYHPEREEWARKANAIFNRNNVQADPSKWVFKKGSTNKIDATVSKANRESIKNRCGEDITEDKKNGGEVAWGNDGTGSFNGTGTWKPNQLPAELKQYALDPTSVGMTYKSRAGWNNAGGQCVHFSSSFFTALWEKNGKTLDSAKGPTGGIGTHNINGGHMAESFSKAYSGTVKPTYKPSKGAIAGVHYGDGGPGHTYIVSHVFANGDILIVEQNVRGYSGDDNGEKCTWNYRIIKQAKYTAQKTQFYTAITDGFQPSKNLKTLP
jgi:CHAP domain./NlpC/P60 family.